MRPTWGPLVVLAAVTALAGCSGSTATSTTSSPAAPATPVTDTVTVAPATSASTARTRTDTVTHTITRSPTTTPSSTSTPSSTPAGTPSCTNGQLRLGVVDSNGAGGTVYVTYRLRNATDHTCTLFGYPGVSIVDRRGAIVQHAARRNDAILPAGVHTGTVTLAPGSAARFAVSSVLTDPDPRCPGPRSGVALRVYPPNQTQPVFLSPRAGLGDACLMTVSPVYTG